MIKQQDLGNKKLSNFSLIAMSDFALKNGVFENMNNSFFSLQEKMDFLVHQRTYFCVYF